MGATRWPRAPCWWPLVYRIVTWLIDSNWSDMTTAYCSIVVAQLWEIHYCYWGWYKEAVPSTLFRGGQTIRCVCVCVLASHPCFNNDRPAGYSPVIRHTHKCTKPAIMPPAVVYEDRQQHLQLLLLKKQLQVKFPPCVFYFPAWSLDIVISDQRVGLWLKSIGSDEYIWFQLICSSLQGWGGGW